MQFNRLPLKLPVLGISVILLASTVTTSPTASSSQDQTFRLLNIERRLDQLQNRIDYVERAQQSQSLSNTGSNRTTEAVLELQSQQVSLAQQIVSMQRQMLEMQKQIDRLAGAGAGEKKPVEKDKPEEKPKPKPATGKP